MHISLTPRALAHSIIAGLLVAFFIAGGVGNLFPTADFRAEYARWGYPDWFHYVTGSLELAAAALLARAGTRHRGALLGGSIMTAALATLLLAGEWLHAALPLAVLMAIAACLYLDEKAREAVWEGKIF